jgi:signal transduction histidine kinase
MVTMTSTISQQQDQSNTQKCHSSEDSSLVRRSSKPDLRQPAVAVLKPDSCEWSEISESFAAVLGYKWQDFQKLHIRDIASREDHATLDQLVTDNSALKPVVLNLVGKDGSLVPFQLAVLRHPNHPEIAAGFHLQAERPDSDKSEAEFVAGKKHMDLLTERITFLATLEVIVSGISHEINQPLNTILLNADTIRIMLESSKIIPVFPLLDDVSWGVRRINEIVEHLRSFTFEKGEGQLTTSDLNCIVRDATQFLEPKLVGHGISLTLKLWDEELFVKANRNQIQQIVANLIARAVDSIENASTSLKDMVVCTLREGDEALIVVEDTGLALSSTKIDELSDPFATDNSAEKGLLFNLAIAHVIAKRFDGLMEAVNNDNEGATVTVRFPLSPNPED